MFENINGDFKLSELFKIPNTSINISTMFGNSSIEELPVGFTLNVQSTNKYCQSAFKDCYNLKYLPSSFELKQNSLCNNMFSGSGL